MNRTRRIDKAILDETPLLTKPLEGQRNRHAGKTILREKLLRDELRKKRRTAEGAGVLVDTLTSFRATDVSSINS